MTPDRFKEFEAAAPNGFKVVQQGEKIPAATHFDVLASYHEKIDFQPRYTTGGTIFDMNQHVIIAYRPKKPVQPREW